MNGKTKLTFIADTHYFSPSLCTKGRAYDLRSDSDQKCLLETGGIIDAAFSDISESDTQAVMIVGDLTNDGEIICHQEFRNKLYELKKRLPVYVVTATHDWCCDCNPRRFIGDSVKTDVDTLMPYKLRDFYYDFGPCDANAEYLTNLNLTSYTVDIGENVRLFALNDDQNGKGRSGYTEEHFEWIEKQAEKARADGKIIIAMEHHLIIAHTSTLITGGTTCVGDREYVASRLADAGIKYIFVGHSHMQSVENYTSENGNVITQINVGSLCGYPAPIVNVTVSEDRLEIKTEKLRSFTHDGRLYDAQQYLKNKACGLIGKVVESGKIGKNEFADRLTALGVNGNKLSRLYFLLKPVLNRLSSATVGEFYTLMKRTGLGGYFDKSAVDEMKDVKVIDIAYGMFLSVLDGTEQPVTADSALYKNVTALTEALKSKLKADIFEQIDAAAKRILLGGEYNISHCFITK